MTLIILSVFHIFIILQKKGRGQFRMCISIYCNFSLAPGFSPVGAGNAAPSRFNGFVAADAENG